MCMFMRDFYLLLGVLGFCILCHLPSKTYGQYGELDVKQFTAVHEKSKGKVTLQWQATATGEIQATGYFMLQKSIDGKKWFRLKTFAYQLYPDITEKFSFIDAYQDDYLYYRLVMRDGQGKAKLLGNSKLDRTRALTDLTQELLVPIKKVYFTYRLEKDRNMLLRLYDGIGQQIFTAALPGGKSGSYDYLLDMIGYKPGVYMVVFTQVEENIKVAERRIEWLVKPTPVKQQTLKPTVSSKDSASTAKPKGATVRNNVRTDIPLRSAQ